MAQVGFVPSSHFCLMALKLAIDIRKATEKVKGIKRAAVYYQDHKTEETINKMVDRP